MTLIELVMFIIVVGIGLAGILSTLTFSVRYSADPMNRKQMLSIAEALLEEVELQPFTYCDPTDTAWATATATAACGTAQGLGPGVGLGQVRISTTTPFNNVADYNGASGSAATTGLGDATHAITDLNGVAGPPVGYWASIAIDNTAAADLGPAAGMITADGSAAGMNVVRITVTVFHGSDTLVLEGYRARYWPNDLPW